MYIIFIWDQEITLDFGEILSVGTSKPCLLNNAGELTIELKDAKIFKSLKHARQTRTRLQNKLGRGVAIVDLDRVSNYWVVHGCFDVDNKYESELFRIVRFVALEKWNAKLLRKTRRGAINAFVKWCESEPHFFKARHIKAIKKQLGV